MFRKSSKQTSAVAACSVSINSAAMRQAFERCERNLDNLVASGTAQPRHKPRATSIVVGMAPVWVPIAWGGRAPWMHTKLLSSHAWEVQRRICIYQIEFVAEEFLTRGILKLCDFGEVKIPNLHSGHHHFEGLLAGCPDGWAEEFDVAQHL